MVSPSGREKTFYLSVEKDDPVWFAYTDGDKALYVHLAHRESRVTLDFGDVRKPNIEVGATMKRTNRYVNSDAQTCNWKGNGQSN